MAEGLLGRCVAVVSGFRFICGVSACKLASHVIKNGGIPPQKVSFMDLCLRLVHLLPDQLFELGGWCVVLKEKQVIQIPPGYIVAETNMSPNSIATSWSWLGTEAMAEEPYNVCQQAVHVDLEHAKQEAGAGAGNTAFLEWTLQDIAVGRLLIPWQTQLRKQENIVAAAFVESAAKANAAAAAAEASTSTRPKDNLELKSTEMETETNQDKAKHQEPVAAQQDAGQPSPKTTMTDKAKDLEPIAQTQLTQAAQQPHQDAGQLLPKAQTQLSHTLQQPHHDAGHPSPKTKDLAQTQLTQSVQQPYQDHNAGQQPLPKAQTQLTHALQQPHHGAGQPSPKIKDLAQTQLTQSVQQPQDQDAGQPLPKAQTQLTQAVQQLHH